MSTPLMSVKCCGPWRPGSWISNPDYYGPEDRDDRSDGAPAGADIRGFHGVGGPEVLEKFGYEVRAASETIYTGQILLITS